MTVLTEHAARSLRELGARSPHWAKEARSRLRDEVAMRVLQGIIAHGGVTTDAAIEIDAQSAYAYADAMLKAREGA